MHCATKDNVSHSQDVTGYIKIEIFNCEDGYLCQVELSTMQWVRLMMELFLPVSFHAIPMSEDLIN